ncbi:unnamed protein product [Ceratitis capitata]|uniref:(Mediterranean fruit fly) hypothetical protein n=1 Tax=Ceratitis capitata TaxID=7213 RepID=A0A811UQM7_CERCA|nr:unnamed protein product [Ceratitis capitata]
MEYHAAIWFTSGVLAFVIYGAYNVGDVSFVCCVVTVRKLSVIAALITGRGVVQKFVDASYGGCAASKNGVAVLERTLADSVSKCVGTDCGGARCAGCVDCDCVTALLVAPSSRRVVAIVVMLPEVLTIGIVELVLIATIDDDIEPVFIKRALLLGGVRSIRFLDKYNYNSPTNDGDAVAVAMTMKMLQTKRRLLQV